jgi:Zn-dependent protease with chaperone function
MRSAKVLPTASTSAAFEVQERYSMTAAPDAGHPQMAPSYQAVYFDGASNRKRSVVLRFDSGLDIVEDGIVLSHWPFQEVRRVDGPPALLRLRCASALPLARIEIADGETIKALVPRLTALDAERGGPVHTGRIVFWSIAAVCSIVAVTVYGLPLIADRLAPLIPNAIERRIGESVDAQVRLIFDGKICNEAEGRAAFKSMVDKVRRASGSDLPLEAEVLSHKLANAFALPGGKVYILDGLLQRARNPDEVAGVLAHELGHVQNRDSLRRIIQTGGTSFLIGLLLGDVTGGGAVIFVARSILDASHSREQEQQADAFAIDTMHGLGRSARPMGEFLLRITGSSEKKGITILNSHPLSEDRLAAMKRQDRPITGPEILTESEWRALKSICKSTAG